jgi:hypothetical protein
MANLELGISMGNRQCGWVRARLSLWVGDGGFRANASNNAEGGDLVAEERRDIQRHLALCTSCREHQLALEQAFGALSAASALAPVDPHVPSLWPMLEQRIAHRDTITIPRRLQTGSALADRLVQTWTACDHKRPQLRSFLVHIGIASFLATLVTSTVARWQWLNAQALIVGNTAPLPQVAMPAYSVDEPLANASDSEDDGDVLATHLAEADLVRLPETSGPRSGVLPTKPANHTRLGYDLDHGTPVAPDTRESKPIY